MSDVKTNLFISKNDQLNAFLLAALVSAIIFILCPVFLLGNNVEEIGNFKLADSLYASVGSFLLGSILIWGLSQFKVLKLSMFTLLIFVTLTTLFLPLTLSNGMLDPAEQPVNVVNLVISLIASIAITLVCLKSQSFKKMGIIFITVIALVNLVLASLAILNVSNKSSNIDGDFDKLSAKKNILVISYDGVPGVVMSKILEEETWANSTLKDFTYFPRTHSQSPSTVASMIGETYGVHDFKAIATDENELLVKLASGQTHIQSFLSKIDDFQKFKYNIGIGKELKIDSPSDKFPNTYLIENSFTRIFTKYVYKTKTPQLFVKLFSKTDKSNQNKDPKKHFGAKWDLKNVKSMTTYDQVIDSFNVTNQSDLSVRFYHNVFSHFPVDFDEQCTYRSDNQDWFYSNQNQNGLENQTRCVLKKIDNFLEKLKKIKAYDNSIIVFKSDHGEPFLYFDDYPNNVMLNRATMHGYNRYRPFMMIKNANIKQNELKYDDRYVLLNDLAKTLCKASRTNVVDCELNGGIDLLSEKQGLDEPHFVYISKDKKSNFSYDTHISIKVPNRRVDFIDFLKEHPGVKVQQCKEPESKKVAKTHCRVRAKRDL